MSAPVCRRCNERHFNFRSCVEGAEAAVVAARRPDRFLRPREGHSAFGNRFDTMQGRQHGDTVVTFIPRTDHPMFVKSSPPKEAV